MDTKMGRLLGIFIFLVFSQNLFAQPDRKLYPVFNSDSTKVGFQDANGKIRIPIRYDHYNYGWSSVSAFLEIGTVQVNSGKRSISRYINRKGKTFGVDSVYVSDATFETEQEGFVRFKDRKNKDEAMGLFNRHGKVVVPAKYNYLTPVRNGMLGGLHGAKKHDLQMDGCEHYTLEGGTYSLLDTTGRVLIKSFPDSLSLNYYSLIRSKSPSKDPSRVSLKSTYGDYFSFVDVKKEFEIWFYESFLKAKNREEMLPHMFIDFGFNRDAVMEKNEFLANNVKTISAILGDLRDGKSTAFIDLNYRSSLRHSESIKRYEEEWMTLSLKHPFFDVFINRTVEGGNEQDHFEFLKTEDGFKWTYVRVRSVPGFAD